MSHLRKHWIFVAVSILFSTSGFASAQDLTGKWAGWLESPGSTAAIRLRIAGRGNSELTMNVYGQQSSHVLTDLSVKGSDVTFFTEVSKDKFSFTGKLEGKAIVGTFEIVSGERQLKGRWSVRPFDDSKVDHVMVGRRGRNELPEPTGTFAIGRRTYYWTDETRPETITDDPNDKRTMLVQIWYPAESDRAAKAAPYIENLDELYASAPNLRIAQSIKIKAKENAPPSTALAKFPVIVFAPGLGESISTYAGILENLVSHGYVIAAFNPSYDAGAFKMPDGRTVSHAQIWGREISGSWTGANRDKFYDDRRRAWAADMSFVLDRLEKLDGELSGKLDFSSVGALGHSFGAQALTITCADDRRFKACVNLDGLDRGSAFLPNAKGVNLKQPFAFFTKIDSATEYELKVMGFSRSEYDARERRRMLEIWRPAMKSRLATLDQGTYFVVFRGATHASFSDGPLLEIDPPDETLADRKVRAEVINQYVLAFFDKFQRSRASRLFDANDNSHPAVVVEFLKR